MSIQAGRAAFAVFGVLGKECNPHKPGTQAWADFMVGVEAAKIEQIVGTPFVYPPLKHRMIDTYLC